MVEWEYDSLFRVYKDISEVRPPISQLNLFFTPQDSVYFCLTMSTHTLNDIIKRDHNRVSLVLNLHLDLAYSLSPDFGLL